VTVYVAERYKLISVCTFHILCLICVKLYIEDLYVMHLSSYDNRYSESHTLVSGIGIATFCVRLGCRYRRYPQSFIEQLWVLIKLAH